MYHLDDQQATQLAKTYEIGKARLADMVRQHEELGEAIEELSEQLGWVDKMLASLNTEAPPRAAAG